MSRTSCRFVLALSLLAQTAAAQTFGPAPDFALDAGSPEVPVPFGTLDVVEFGAASIAVSGSMLGLVPGDVVSSVSDGYDSIGGAGPTPPEPDGWAIRTFYYSVDRASLGFAGGVVEAEANPGGDGAAGDMFRAVQAYVPVPPGGGGTFWFMPDRLSNAPAHGLTPRSDSTESDIDAMDVGGLQIVRDTNFRGLWFTLAAGSPTLAALGADPATVLYQGILVSGAPPPVVYATPAQLGLQPGDAIDALAMLPTFGATSWTPTDVVWASLRPASPTLSGLPASPADILELGVFLQVRVAACLLDLLPTDDLDALTVTDPGGAWSHVMPGGDCGSAGLQLLANAPPALGETLTVNLVPPPPALGAVFVGFQPVTLPLFPFGTPLSCILRVDPGTLPPITFTGGGPAELALPIPADPAMFGLALFFQGSDFGPNPFQTGLANLSLSCAVHAVIGF